MRIALTGATGFVGRAVMRQLAVRNHEVSVLVRKPAQFTDSGEARVVAGDLFNKMALADLVKGADAVLHLAGAIKALRREGYFAANRDGTANLAEAARAAGTRRFVHVSSLAAREPQLSDYAASKRAAEEVLSTHAAAMNILIVRASAVYGPGDVATLPLLKALTGSLAVFPGRSEQRFSLIHVDDLAAVLCEALERDTTGTIEVDDLSGGHDWAELIDLAQAAYDRPGRHVFLPYAVAASAGFAGDVLAAITGQPQMLSSGKMRELYHPDWVVAGRNWPRPHPIGLGQGLPETIRAYQAEGKLPHLDGPDRSEHHD